MQNSKFAVTQVRLTPEILAGLHKLRQAGYLPAALIRSAIGEMVAKKLKEIEGKNGE
jgi:hypothetical protein